MAAPAQRYVVLDGLRGFAALAVVIFHIGSRVGAPIIVTHGYLAVDFFFILSGFVIAHSYSARLETLGLVGFSIIRAQRLLPLSIFGVVLGTAYLILRWRFLPSDSDTLPQILAASGLNLALIPKLWRGRATMYEVFPADGNLWSLSLEVLVNLAWAAVFVRARYRLLGVAVFIAGVVLIVLARDHQSADLGWNRLTYLGGVARAVFGFGVGILIWRFRPSKAIAPWLPWTSVAILLGLLCVPLATWWFDILAIMLAFPVIIYFAASTDMAVERPFLRIMGEISYPLYVAHLPVLMISSGIMKKLHPGMQPDNRAYLLAIPAILLAILADRLYDAPIRRYLSRRRAQRRQIDLGDFSKASQL